MGMQGKPLADGQAATTQTAIYTVPASTYLIGGQIHLFNTNAAAQTVIVAYKFVTNGNTIRTFKNIANIAQNEDVSVDCPDLGPGDLVYLTTTTATALNYVLFGGLQT